SVSFALTGAVVGEFVGASSGLGYRLNIAAGLLDTKRVYLILLILMVFAVTLVEIAKRVEARLLRWRPSAVLAGQGAKMRRLFVALLVTAIAFVACAGPVA